MMDVTTLLPDITIAVPAVPENVVLHMARRAAADFVARTGIWRESQEMTGVDDTLQYAFPLTGYTNVQVKTILSVTLNDAILRQTAYTLTESHALLFDSDVTICDDDEIVAFVEIEALPAATSFPTAFLQDYHSAIVGRAVELLCTMPARPWTDLQTAAMARLQFYAGVRRAKIYVERHGTARGTGYDSQRQYGTLRG